MRFYSILRRILMFMKMLEIRHAVKKYNVVDIM
jgi:hypothetical protein